MRPWKKLYALMTAGLFLFMSIGAFSASAEDGNLITNGDFETLNAAEDYPSGWNLAGNTVGKDTESGNHFISMSGGTITSQVISAGINEMTTYEFKGLVKSSGSANPLLTITYGIMVEGAFQSLTEYAAANTGLVFMKNVNNVVQNEESIHFLDGITAAHEVVFSILTPPHASAVKVSLRGSAASADVTWDNISLVEKIDVDVVNYGTMEYGLKMRGANYVTLAPDPKDPSNDTAKYVGTATSPAAGKNFDDIFILGGRNYVVEYDIYADRENDVNTPAAVNPRLVLNALITNKSDGTNYGGAYKTYDLKAAYTVSSDTWVHCKSVIRIPDDGLIRRLQVVPRPAAAGTYYYDNVAVRQDVTTSKFYSGDTEIFKLPKSGTIDAVCHFAPDAYVTSVNPIFVVGVYKTIGSAKILADVYVNSGSTATGESFDIKIQSVPLEDGISVEAMVWNDFNGMTPYIAKKSLNQ